MGEVIVTLKVLPKSTDIDLDKLESKIKTLVKADQIKREPIAFGLVALNVTKIVPDSGGEVDSLEDKLKKLEEVGEVEVVEITRTL